MILVRTRNPPISEPLSVSGLKQLKNQAFQSGIPTITPKNSIIEINIKMALNTVMEQDSENDMIPRK